MMSSEPTEFWGDAHKYAFTTGEEQFVVKQMIFSNPIKVR